jgi:hypothetical protein
MDKDKESAARRFIEKIEANSFYKPCGGDIFYLFDTEKSKLVTQEANIILNLFRKKYNL